MKRYPYDKSRIYLSAVITGLSIVLASMLLFREPVLMLFYFLLTLATTITTFLLKKRFYPLLTTEKSEAENQQHEEKQTAWKTLLPALSMLLAFLLVPLFLAWLLPDIWFILIVSFTSGVSISEILLYIQTR